ncbi:MBL fold metallo-hydrolase [Alkaliflexus imshenetskii]|uniref:MBL fold metallo-hydrolase n=1 Tax=Alkaliflexus imshenetskii TaxID=286730 RepID=UPI00047B4936|nr:MBL fold metallo-hydrolase [Alkaliflexus imshenetskii]
MYNSANPTNNKELKIKVLIDNAPHPEKPLQTEHGLSIWFEIDTQKWLLDLGDSSAFAENASHLGINLSEVDYVLLSHGHKDHTGGLAQFLTINHHATIFLSENMPGQIYLSLRDGLKRDISIDHKLLKKHPHRFRYIGDNTIVNSHVAIVCKLQGDFPAPLANQSLFIERDGTIMPDDFTHELAISIKTAQGMTVLSGCAHNGILNTLHAVSAFHGHNHINCYFGGTHLPDSRGGRNYETGEDIDSIAWHLKTNFPEMQLITSHCTGNKAKEIFNDTLKNKLTTFYSGFSIEL